MVITLISAAAVMLAGGTAAAKKSPLVLCVNPDGSGGCYATIQDAVNATPTGHQSAEIDVADGEYIEHVDVPKGKRISIVGPSANVNVDPKLFSDENVGSVLTLEKGSQVSISNMVIGEGTAPQGGAIDALAPFTLKNVAVFESTAQSSPGLGGCIYYQSKQGKALIEASEIGSCHADDSGGIIYTDGNLTIEGSRVEHSSATKNGGAIDVAGGNLVLLNTEIDSATASGSGGGIAVENGKVQMVNSTIAGCHAVNGDGGAIALLSGRLRINDSTLFDNTTENNAGGIANGAGKNSVAISNSILVSNSAGGSGNECTGQIKSLGYNLIDDTTGCSLFGKTSADIISGNADITDLENCVSAGSLDLPCAATFAKGGGSAAIGAGNPKKPTGHGNLCAPTDAFGDSRASGCDIGAAQAQ